jgi:alkyl hydroperoxide reductase subunit AhpF
MLDPKVTVYGAYWCPDCRRSKKFLGEQFIPYRWVDIGHDLSHAKEIDEPLPFETSVSGIFAAGDVRHGCTRPVASAVGEGAAASISIRDFLRRSE